MQHTEHVVREAGKEIDRLRQEVNMREEQMKVMGRDTEGMQREIAAQRRELDLLREIEDECQAIQSRGAQAGLLPPMKVRNPNPTLNPKP